VQLPFQTSNYEAGTIMRDEALLVAERSRV
jgi:hypothetical protein